MAVFATPPQGCSCLGDGFQQDGPQDALASVLLNHVAERTAGVAGLLQFVAENGVLRLNSVVFYVRHSSIVLDIIA